MLEERGVGYVFAVLVNQHVHARVMERLVERRANALVAPLSALAEPDDEDDELVTEAVRDAREYLADIDSGQRPPLPTDGP